MTPEFKGPKWYISPCGGSTVNEGSVTAPLAHISGAYDKAASGDTLVLLKGTHSGSNNRGFSWDENDKPMVVMGDPSYVADSTIIDAGGKDRHFYFSGGDSIFQIIGLTLYNGQSSDGGSVYVSHTGTKPIFKNVLFKGNSATGNNYHGGGAVMINSAGPAFYDCRFEGNTRIVEDTEHARGGATVSYTHLTLPTILLV